MKDIRKKISFEWIMTALFGLTMLIQIIMIIKFNLSDIRESLDADFSYTVYHYMQVIKNGTLNLQNWNHTTSLELDATFLFALPLFYLVKDIFLAVGISNIIIMCLYIAVIYKLLSLIKVRLPLIFMVITLVLTPYAFGMLDYFNMMFYGGACYSIKILVPIMLLMLMVWNKKSEKKSQNVLRMVSLVGYLILLFATTFSTGIYVVMCGLTPIILCALVDIWKDGSLKGKYTFWHVQLLIFSGIDFVIGMILHQKYYGLVSRTSLNLTKYANWDTNLRACIIAPFQVLGATTSEDIKATSVIGIFLIMKIALAVLLLFVALRHIPKLFEKTSEIAISKYLTMMFVFNFLLLVVADCRYTGNLHIEYRYMLIGIVPLYLLLGIWLEECGLHWNAFQRNIILAALLAATLFVSTGNNNNISKHWDRTKYAMELSDYLADIDVESVFMVDDIDSVAYLRSLNGEKKFGSYNSTIPGLESTICSYSDGCVGSTYGHKNAIVIFNFKTMQDYFPEDISSHYSYYGSVRWFDVYIADEIYF